MRERYTIARRDNNFHHVSQSTSVGNHATGASNADGAQWHINILNLSSSHTQYKIKIIIVYILWGKNGGRKYIYLFNTSVRRRKLKHE